MTKNKNIYRVPIDIKGLNENKLIKAMVENNQKVDKEYHYFDIQKDGGIWFAWYYKDLKAELTKE